MVKGNIVQFERGGKHGIVLAMRKDGTRANVYRYGPDRAEWVPVEWLTVKVDGLDTCGKCIGTGVYYFGGAVVNGSYTGQTGPCYACQGKGKQNNDDRVRCHHYWHRQREIEAAVEAVERGEEYTPLSVPWMAPDDTVLAMRRSDAEFTSHLETVVAEVNDNDAPPF